jgi:hypothetical protein
VTGQTRSEGGNGSDKYREISQKMAILGGFLQKGTLSRGELLY